MKRGWMSKNWRTQKAPLQQISGNAVGVDSEPAKSFPDRASEGFPEETGSKLTDRHHSLSIEQDGASESKPGRSKKFKVKGETQTGKYLLVVFIKPR